MMNPFHRTKSHKCMQCGTVLAYMGDGKFKCIGCGIRWKPKGKSPKILRPSKTKSL